MLNREAWLLEAVTKLRPYFENHTLEIPDRIRVTCGWPSRRGLSEKNPVVGECFKAEAAEDGVVQIFISPRISDPVRALDILVHELIHACLPEAKHGKDFKTAAKDLGLQGPAKATVAGEELKEYLTSMALELGSYDHAKLDKIATSETKPQKNRQLKIFCPEEHESGEEYVLRGSNKVLDMGLPDCPLCGAQMKREESA